MVSKDCLKRALNVANDLFVFLEQRAHRVTMAPTDARYSRMGLNHRDEEKKQNDHDYQYSGGAWRGPARPTLLFVDTVAIGLTVFELSEHVEVRYVGGDEKYARVGSPADRATPRRPHDWTTKQWLVSGRLGVHAYAPYEQIRWERYWREKKSGELRAMFTTIAKELESQAPTIVRLLEQEKRDAEERRRKWEAERREMEKREVERRRAEREAQRQKEIVETISTWRLARDLRAYVAEIKALVHDAGLEITKGGNAEDELTWAAAYANRIDPLSSWKQDIAKVRTKLAGEPCPECGKVHDAPHVEDPPAKRLTPS